MTPESDNTPKRGNRYIPLAIRLKSYTADPVTGCWIWTKAKTKRGYGKIQVGNKHTHAHRVSYEHSRGITLPPEIAVCHRCDNPPCINPAHLFEGSAGDNQRDCLLKGRHTGSRENNKGHLHPKAKLTIDQALDVIDARRTGRATEEELAVKYGISTSRIYYIATGRSYKLANRIYGQVDPGKALGSSPDRHVDEGKVS